MAKQRGDPFTSRLRLDPEIKDGLPKVSLNPQPLRNHSTMDRLPQDRLGHEDLGSHLLHRLWETEGGENLIHGPADGLQPVVMSFLVSEIKVIRRHSLQKRG